MTTQIELITPEIAKNYLEHNKGNRRIKESTLNMLVREIKDGKFRLTHQGIAFDEDGSLVDGQHRLMACIVAGQPIQSLVIRGMERDAVQYVDLGVKRTFDDVVKMTGLFADNPAKRNKGTAAAVKSMVNYGYNMSIRLSISETVALMDFFSVQCEQIYKASITRKSATSYVNAAALSALICGEDYSDIYNFFSVFSNGDSSSCESYNISAAFNWRQQILDAKVHHVDFKPGKLYFGTQNAIWNFIHSDARTIRMPKNARYSVYSILDLYFHPQKTQTAASEAEEAEAEK